MTEMEPELAMTRAEFMKFASATVGGLLLPNWLLNEVANAGDSIRQASSAEFETTASWLQDFSRMRDGQPSPRFWGYTTGNEVPGYNNEAETYTSSPENVYIKDGILTIEARKQNKDDRLYTSGRISTLGKFDFLYGKLEINTKLPKGVGTWPAGWLLPSSPKYNPSDFGLTGASANWKINGEIDIFEAVGANPGLIYPSVHTASNAFEETNGSDPFHIKVPDDTEHFHTYGVEKLPGSIVFTFDGRPYHTIKKQSSSPEDWPFDQPYYVILNLAMGGTWGGIAKAQFPPEGIDNSQAPWKLEVGSVAFFDLAKNKG